MPSLFCKRLIPDPDNFNEMIITRNSECKIDLRLHPAQDVKGGRPTNRFQESPQKQKDHKVKSQVYVLKYDKVVCSVNLHHFIRLELTKSFDIEATVDNSQFWKRTFTTCQLDEQEFKHFTLSPEFQMKLEHGHISLKIVVTYQSKALEDPEFNPHKEHCLLLNYFKNVGEAPVLFDPKWLPPIPYEPRVRAPTVEISDSSKSVKRKRVEFEEPKETPSKRQSLTHKRECVNPAYSAWNILANEM